MKIENDIFVRKRPCFEEFVKYGFTESKDGYVYECDFMNGDFHAVITADKLGRISGNVIDKMTDEEYLPMRAENRNGAFVNTVRHEYEKILLSIAKSCYNEVLFVSKQANRIAEQIFQKYSIRPDFPWNGKAFKSYGTFRHEKNQKWFALIMNIKMSVINKTADDSLMKDIINLKIDSKKGDEIRQENGIYMAYHMNHKNWISVILDDTLTDERVMELLDISYTLTK